MHLRVRDYIFSLIALGFIVLTTSLGFWQLRRLAQRRAQNAKVIARLAQPPVPVRELTRDSAAFHYRRVLLNGVYDYAHEIRITDRIRNGSPGVNIITPLRIAGTDTAVLVNRGWVYSPDGVTVDLSRWREPDSVNATGYARPLFKPFPGSAALAGRPDAFRWVDVTAVRSRIPYPVYPMVIVLEGNAAPHAQVPPRIPPPPLDEGPHRSYAIQWFSFAVVAAAGTFFFLRSAPTRSRDTSSRT